MTGPFSQSGSTVPFRVLPLVVSELPKDRRNSSFEDFSNMGCFFLDFFQVFKVDLTAHVHYLRSLRLHDRLPEVWVEWIGLDSDQHHHCRPADPFGKNVSQLLKLRRSHYRWLVWGVQTEHREKRWFVRRESVSQPILKILDRKCGERALYRRGVPIRELSVVGRQVISNKIARSVNLHKRNRLFRA